MLPTRRFALLAAAVGVGARLSEAKSMSVVSVSCPTAEITGMRDDFLDQLG